MNTTQNSIIKNKLKDLNKTPSDVVWTNISKALDKKEQHKKRIIPLWFRYGSAVASIILLLLSGKSFLETTTQTPKETTPISTTIMPLNNNKTQTPNDVSVIANNDSINTPPRLNTPKEKPITAMKSADYNSTSKNLKEKTGKTNQFAIRSKQKNTALANNDKNNNRDPLIIINANTLKELEQVKKDTAIPIIKNNKEVIALNNTTNKNIITDSITLKTPFIATQKKEVIIHNIQDDDYLTKAKEKKQKWQIASVVSIRSDLITDNTNMSYGARIDYAIYPKLQIRSGINKTNSSQFDTPPNNNSSDISSGFGEEIPTPTQYSYTEIPVGLEYQLLDNKFGMSIIGGVSSLFFDVKDNDASIKNINLGNIGLGFNYKLSKRLKFQIEPMYKKQINTKAVDHLSFKSSLWAVSGGLSYRF